MSSIEDRLKIIKGALSGRKFAEKLGVSSTTVNQYLNGRTPPVEFIVLVCGRFGVDSWWLLTGEERPLGDIETTGQVKQEEACSHKLHLKSMPKPLILVDEPEVHIHPKTSKKLSEVIAQLTEAQKKDVLKYAEERLVLASHRSECEGKKA